MFRKVFFWLHLSIGALAGVFIFAMSATGVMLAFERQITGLLDRNIRFVLVPEGAHPRSMNELLDAVRNANLGNPTAIVVRDQPQASLQFLIGRSKSVYVDPYDGSVLGASSTRAHAFFFAVERLHRALGAPLGSKTLGHWLAAASNLLFGVLIVLGIVLWLPRKWSWKSIRAAIAFRAGLRGRSREWNWHNVLGIWCALPLLVIVLTGVIMSFDWANTLLFRLAGSPTPANAHGGGDRPSHIRGARSGNEPNYEYLVTVAKQLNRDWQTITLNLPMDQSAGVSAVVDTGSGGQPQKRTQYFLDRETGAVLKKSGFADASLGQRLRAFVRFGHTGEYGGLVGQVVAAFASFGACVLAYTGLSLFIRRVVGTLKRKRNVRSAPRKYAEQMT